MTLQEIENKLQPQFKRIEDIAYHNQKKVLDAFIDCKISSQCFNGTTGYGYDDVGRDTLGRLYAKIFGAETAIVSPLLTCGSHAISTVLFGLLRPSDVMLSATGIPYDTLHDTLFGKDNGSLEEFGIKYEQVDLQGDDIQVDKVIEKIKALKPKIVYFQRSRGYSSRKAFSVDVLEKVFKQIKPFMPKDGFIVVDNCYGEFVEKK